MANAPTPSDAHLLIHFKRCSSAIVFVTNDEIAFVKIANKDFHSTSWVIYTVNIIVVKKKTVSNKK